GKRSIQLSDSVMSVMFVISSIGLSCPGLLISRCLPTCCASNLTTGISSFSTEPFFAFAFSSCHVAREEAPKLSSETTMNTLAAMAVRHMMASLSFMVRWICIFKLLDLISCITVSAEILRNAMPPQQCADYCRRGCRVNHESNQQI